MQPIINIYIILTRKHIYIVDGWNGPRYIGRPFLSRLICFLIDITINMPDHGMPRKQLVMNQMFRDIPTDYWEAVTQNISYGILRHSQ